MLVSAGTIILVSCVCAGWPVLLLTQGVVFMLVVPAFVRGQYLFMLMRAECNLAGVQMCNMINAHRYMHTAKWQSRVMIHPE